MSDWVHSLAQEWGHWMRKADAVGGSIQGTLGRSIDLHDGASIREYGQRIPILDFPNDVNKFHRAWKQLPSPLQGLILVDYKVRAGHKEKRKALRMKRDKYYRTRKQALNEIARLMATN